MPAPADLAGAVHLDRRVGAPGCPGAGRRTRTATGRPRLAEATWKERDVPELDVQPADHPAVVDEHALRAGGVDLTGRGR